MSNCWPDSITFWRYKRVTVTGGSGFLGSFVVDKLRQRGAADITFASLSAGFISRQRDDDPSTLLRAGPSTLLRAGLVQREAARQLLADARPGSDHPSGGQFPRNPRPDPQVRGGQRAGR